MAKHYRWNPIFYIGYNVLGLLTALTAFSELQSLELPESLRVAGRWQFLTNLALAVTAFTTIANIVTVAQPKLFSKVDNYLNAIAIVLETIVAMIYWSLKIFFRDLIIRRAGTIPVRIDVMVHLFPIIFLSIDYYFNKVTNFNIGRLTVRLSIITLTCAYWTLLDNLIIPPAEYPYPFLNVNAPKRAVIFATIALLAIALYQLHDTVHAPLQRLLYGEQKGQKAK